MQPDRQYYCWRRAHSWAARAAWAATELRGIVTAFGLVGQRIKVRARKDAAAPSSRRFLPRVPFHLPTPGSRARYCGRHLIACQIRWSPFDCSPPISSRRFPSGIGPYGEDFRRFGIGINYVFVLVKVVGMRDVLNRVAALERRLGNPKHRASVIRNCRGCLDRANARRSRSTALTQTPTLAPCLYRDRSSQSRRFALSFFAGKGLRQCHGVRYRWGGVPPGGVLVKMAARHIQRHVTGWWRASGRSLG